MKITNIHLQQKTAVFFFHLSFSRKPQNISPRYFELITYIIIAPLTVTSNHNMMALFVIVVHDEDNLLEFLLLLILTECQLTGHCCCGARCHRKSMGIRQLLQWPISLLHETSLTDSSFSEPALSISTLHSNSLGDEDHGRPKPE